MIVANRIIPLFPFSKGGGRGFVEEKKDDCSKQEEFGGDFSNAQAL